MALSWSQQPTVLFSIRQNNTWTIRCFFSETNDPATQCKILKIVGFLHTKVEGRRVEEFPQFHSYCILFSTFQPTITGTVSTVVVHYGKHTFGTTSIGKHPSAQWMTEAAFSHSAKNKGQRLKKYLAFGQILKLNVEIFLNCYPFVVLAV